MHGPACSSRCFGLDIAQARVVVVKSRGHFRGGFDEFFKPEQIYEVDCPGLTSPVLANFTWTKLPRPVYPLDEETSWTPPTGVWDRRRKGRLSCCAVRCLPWRRVALLSRTGVGAVAQDAARGHAFGSQDPRSGVDHTPTSCAITAT